MGRGGAGGAGLAALALVWSAAASARAEDVVRYLPADYAAYAPQTALDMVRRTPGFTLEQGDTDLRGFGAGAGNVLIDGVRPSSKLSLAEALARIPADQVERIELIRNAATAEAQGRALVLNVVRKSGGASGAWSAELEGNGNREVYPRVEASRAGRLLGWEASVRTRAYREVYPFRALRTFREPDGRLLSTVTTDLPSTFSEAFVAGEARRSAGGGSLTVTGRLAWSDYRFNQPGAEWLSREPDGPADRTLFSTRGVETKTAELGADYAREVGGWTWKTLGLLAVSAVDQGQLDERREADGRLISAGALEARSRPFEAVARITAAPAAQRRLRPEVGAEVAYNRRSSRLDLTVDDGTGPTPVVLPAASVVVDEWRGEAFASAAFTLSPRWTLEGGLAAETSRIGVTGDAERSSGFTFVKPWAAASWRAGPQLLLRAEVRRLVGQLAFADFAASADLNDKTAAAGNPDLGPDQTTRFALSADWRGAGDLALNVELFHEDRSDVLERVLLPSGAEGLANAGDATVRGVKARATVPLDVLLAGARLSADGEWRDTRFEDPLTGRARPLSDVWTPMAQVEFRHDPPGLPAAWGVTYRSARESHAYYVDLIDTASTNETWDGFVETTAVRPLRVRLAVRAAGTARRGRERRFYDPDRSGALAMTESRRIRTPAFVTLTVSGRF